MAGKHTVMAVWASALLLPACGSSGDRSTLDAVNVSDEELAERAYVISEQSDELFVMDLGSMTEVGKVDTSLSTGVNSNHMSMLSGDARKLYVMATNEDAAVVVDTATLQVIGRIPLGAHPTHAEACLGCPPDGRDLLWVVNEGGGHGEGAPAESEEEHGHGSVSIIDMGTDEVIATFEHESLEVPHFVRFHDRSAFIPSIGGNQITVVDLDSLQVSDVLLREGVTEPGPCSGDPCGFADAQIDRNGLLVAAHIETGQVLSYDAAGGFRRADLRTGNKPWSIFVDSMSDDFDTHLMPNWGDSTVSLIDRVQEREVARSAEGDVESFGVNYSPLAPGQAFVLNRIKERIAVIDRNDGSLIEALDVGGTTETASTSGDGRYLLLPISSTNQFSVFDVTTRTEVARFDEVGTYPWSVTTVGGQNYCH